MVGSLSDQEAPGAADGASDEGASASRRLDALPGERAGVRRAAQGRPDLPAVHLRFAHITLAAPVDRLAAVARFYGRDLGFELDAPQGDRVTFHVGETSLELVAAPRRAVLPLRPPRARRSLRRGA